MQKSTAIYWEGLNLPLGNMFNFQGACWAFGETVVCGVRPFAFQCCLQLFAFVPLCLCIHLLT